MNSYAASVLLLLAVFFCLAESARPPLLGCRPGTTKNEGSRSCVCSRLAVWECKNIGHSHHKRSPRGPPPVGCSPGSRKVEGFKTCVCSRLAVWECSQIGHQQHKREAAAGGRKCTPGQRWTDECGNRCFCNQNGASVCTEMGCIRPKRTPQVSSKPTSCVPGKPFKVDCSTCWCGPDGRSSSCEYTPCPK